ncbi:MAG: VCBS repeat-containing protein, partial [Kiritimatiellae bacterium]|nr:VCBS repeat-containing protein [Kiritimatiellia bacterium]
MVLACVTVACVGSLIGQESGELRRLPYNNPGLEVDLGVGLWAWPLPMDFDGDGDIDLAVACPDKPHNGLYFFENATGRTSPRWWLPGLDSGAKTPVFKAGRRISGAPHNVQVSYVHGVPQVLTPGTAHPEFVTKGVAAGVKIEGVAANVHPNRVRANMWRYADFDGDGAQDLVIGVGDWTEYGWDNAYDAAGVWKNGPLRGFVYVVRNKGTTAQPQYAEPVRIEADGKPLEVFGSPSPNVADWDGDGDLDILCGEFLDGFTYFQNVGTRTAPRYAAGRRVHGKDNEPLVMDLQMITPTAIDWDGDGDLDLICGDEDGRVAFIENTGRLDSRRAPVFCAPLYFRQEAADVKFGALVTPAGVDWDGDGDWDFVCGNTAGYIAFIENLSGPGVAQPRWAEPCLLEADGKIIRIMAGQNGSIQGPAEAKWGYTTLGVADWDGDGLPDLLVNSIWGKVEWYRNVGTRSAPKLAAALPVEVEWEGAQPALAWGWMRPEGKALLTQWRTTPAAADWNRDGLVDLVMLDHEGYLAFFERAERDGRRVLLHPRRIFRNEKGEALRFNARRAGGSGRRKLCVVDWDGDGKLDILINSKNAELWRQTG